MNKDEISRSELSLFCVEMGPTRSPSRGVSLPFGLPSPFQAIYTIHHQADDMANKYSLASAKIKSDTYVDDIITGASSASKATELAENIYRILQMADMETHKWTSNIPEVLQKIPLKLCSSDYETKILGILWNSIMDKITIPIITGLKEETGHQTMRKVIANVAKVFDPLGLLSPWVLKGKLIIQELWKKKSDWDKILPPSQQKVFNKWLVKSKNVTFFKQP